MTGIWQRIRGGGQPGLTCVALVELVTDYLEGTLSPSEHARVETHLGACENCTRYVEEMRTTIALVGRIEEDDLSEEAKSELLEAFRGWARG
jgi:anti-sigma factor RsiW